MNTSPPTAPAPGTAIVAGKGFAGDDLEDFLASPVLGLALVRPGKGSYRTEPAAGPDPSRQVTTASPVMTSLAARSPERTAPSIFPYHTGEVSVPAQCSGPIGARTAGPYEVQIPWVQ